MGQKYFSSEIFQNYLVFIPFKNTLNILAALLGLIPGSHGMTEVNIENITTSGSYFASTFVDHHALPDLNFMDTV